MSEINFFWDPALRQHPPGAGRNRRRDGRIHRGAGPLRQHHQPELGRGGEPTPLRRPGLDPGRHRRQPERHRHLRLHRLLPVNRINRQLVVALAKIVL